MRGNSSLNVKNVRWTFQHSFLTPWNKWPCCTALLIHHSAPGEHITIRWSITIPDSRVCKWSVWHIGFSQWLQMAPSNTRVSVLSVPRQNWVRTLHVSTASADFSTCGWQSDIWKSDSGERSEIAFLSTMQDEKEISTYNEFRPVIKKTFSPGNYNLLTFCSALNICGVLGSICHVERKPSAQCLHPSTVFRCEFYVYVSLHASFVICVDMKALEDFYKLQNNGAQFHLQ